MRKKISGIAVATMVSLGALGMVACNKNEENIQIQTDQQGTGIGEYKGDVEVTPQAPTQIQNTGDPIKDEASWPIGEFGYHEPPEELRTYNINPQTNKRTNSYRIPIHSDKYGDLELQYNEKLGQRTLFKAGMGSTGQLMIISEDNPISIEQALEDLRIGDSIADNFGK